MFTALQTLSKLEGRVSYIAVLSSQRLNTGLPGATSIFTARMEVVKTVIEELIEINNEPCNYTIEIEIFKFHSIRLEAFVWKF